MVNEGKKQKVLETRQLQCYLRIKFCLKAAFLFGGDFQFALSPQFRQKKLNLAVRDKVGFGGRIAAPECHVPVHHSDASRSHF